MIVSKIRVQILA